VACFRNLFKFTKYKRLSNQLFSNSIHMEQAQNKPLISIISINYNQSKVTLDFLKSLESLTYPNYEVIVVDNASPNDRPDLITEKFPHVSLIKSSKNLGFAGGNNIGILHSKGEYLFFINNDTEVHPNCLEPLVEVFYAHPNVGMVSPKIIFHQKKDERIMQYAGGSKLNYTTGVGAFFGYGEIDQNQYQSAYTEIIHGAAVMVPRKLIEKIGVWPDLYFLYYEEIDWSEHFKNAGYKLYYESTSEIYHKESMSIGKATPLRVLYMNRNRALFIRRNTFGFRKWWALFYFFFASYPKSVLQFVIKKRFDLLVALNKAIWWNLSHFRNLHSTPQLLQKNGTTLIKDGYYKYYT